MTKGWLVNGTFYPRDGLGLAFDRLIFFSDAVYAIALTLVAVEIGVPEIEGDPRSVAALWQALVVLSPKLLAFLVAFLFVAVYWRANHQLTQRLRGINGSYITATLCYLMFIAILPLPAAILGEHLMNPLAVAIFMIFLFIVSSLEVVLFVIARRGHLFLVAPSTASTKAEIAGAMSPLPGFLLAIPIAFVAPVGALIFVLIASVLCGMACTRLFPPDEDRSASAAA